MKKSIILIGRICSGKSSLAKLLSESLHIPKASFGGYLANLAPQLNLEANRENLQNLGQSLIDKNADKFLEDVIIYSGSSEEMIFEGVRHEIIKEKIEQISQSTISFYIEVSQEVRYKRCIERQGINISYNDFCIEDGHLVEKEIESLKKNCNHFLDGNQTLLILKEKIINYLAEVK
ncbi:ATP-binding protein [Pelobium sp.]|nr:AAA family ATPase [Pelobium sp.]MDA9554653.1 ATP-binding protein [Pelobium sp.]